VLVNGQIYTGLHIIHPSKNWCNFSVCVFCQ